MNVLVTGGCGVIGSQVARIMAQDGHDVTVLDIRRGAVQVEGVRYVTADVRDYSAVGRIIREIQPSSIFHLAASFAHKESLEVPIKDMDTNIFGTLTVLESCRVLGISPRIVYASTSAIFGEPQTTVLDENHPLDPMTPYALSKLAGELYLNAYHARHDIPCVSLRFFNVYGPGEYPSPQRGVVPRFLYNILRERAITIYGSGKETRTFTYASDAAHATILASTVEAAVGETFNIAASNEYSILDLVDTLREVLKRDVAVQYVGSRPGDTRRRYTSVDKARQILGFQAKTSLRDGLTNMARWFKDEWEDICEIAKPYDDEI